MDFNKKRLAVNVFFMAQFNYCALHWMCYNNRTCNNKINRLHESCLRLINDKRSSFEDLLEKDNSVSLHHKNLQALAIEIFKVHTKTSSEIMPQVKSVNYGLKSIRALGPKI